MFLNRLRYSEFEGLPNSWELSDTQFENINLLIGRNATGKTRTLNVISGLAALISGVANVVFQSGTFNVSLIDGAEQYDYELSILNKSVKHEKLTINGIVQLDRHEDGSCNIKAIQLNAEMKIKVPNNQLVVTTRRDEIQHPYLETLYKWANGYRHYNFGSSLGKESGIVYVDVDNISVDSRDVNQVSGMLVKGLQTFQSKFKNSIINEMKSIGYEIQDVGIAPIVGMPVFTPNGQPVNLIYVHEKDRLAPTFQGDMSQGMFRVLSLIIQTLYNQFQQAFTTVSIDDIGEGLDFERSVQLVSLLIDKAEKDHIQLIMASNDKFIMNTVPLKYWQVIQRDKSVCRLYNHKNSPAIFNDFKFTGLSNFDFFATDFYKHGFKVQ